MWKTKESPGFSGFSTFTSIVENFAVLNAAGFPQNFSTLRFSFSTENVETGRKKILRFLKARKGSPGRRPGVRPRFCSKRNAGGRNRSESFRPPASVPGVDVGLQLLDGLRERGVLFHFLLHLLDGVDDGGVVPVEEPADVVLGETGHAPD